MVIYLLAVLVALAIFVLSLDELFVDLLYVFRGRKKSRKTRTKDLRAPEKRIALIVCCWDEAKVIGQMLRSTIERVRYNNLTIFVGVYPNDLGTVSAVDEMIKEYPGRIVKVVNDLPGPTSKAQNLNWVWRFLKEQYDKAFDIVVFHDAEDFVHSDSLRVINEFVPPHYDMVQIPVFPIQPRFRLSGLKKFIRWLVTGTYADEFAENHLHHMLVREAVGTFVPSAGVGTAFSWQALESLVREERGGPFNPASHTEDYELSRRAGIAGFRTGYVLVRNDRGKIVATQALFPNRFSAAVKQKARWVFGITMQQFDDRSDWRKKSLMQSYFLWRDEKAKYTSVLNIAGYVVSICLVCGLLTGSLPRDGALKQIFSWLLLANGICMIERQIMRFWAVSRRYGFREAAMAILIPPLFPVRYIIGNLINFAATVRAWRMWLAWRKKGSIPWSKTNHDVYPEGGNGMFRTLLIISLALCLLPSHSQATGWHWAGFGNELDESSWVLRGATQHFVPVLRIEERLGFGLTFGEEHAFGSDPERPWTREIKFFAGPAARSVFVFEHADVVLSGGVNLMAGVRKDQHDLIISPYVTAGVNWRLGERFPGYSWGIIRGRSLYEKGLLTSGSFEQGYNLSLFLSERGRLSGCLYTGSWFIYGSESEYWWNRKARLILGSRIEYGFGKSVLQIGIEGYRQWSKMATNALRGYVAFSTGW